MKKNSKRKILFITLMLTLMLVSSAYTILVPDAHALELTSSQKAEAISKDVVGLDLTNYGKTVQELPPDSYLGVVPQENIRYTLDSVDGKVDIRYTFADGKLRILHVLETEGSPRLTKTAVNTLANAKDFLNSYQRYSGKPFYSELSTMLNAVDSGKNFTKTFGNAKLETTTSDRYETFRWTYTYNGIEAPSKFVSLGYEKGFLKYFVDNWDLYTIGSTDVNISEAESINMAMDNARNFSWKMGSDNGTFEVRNFTVAQAMVTQTVLSNFVYPDKARDNDPLTLYPMRCMWVSLDKFYPGNVYGIEVYIWADTKEIGDIKERFSTLEPPPDQLASLDDFAIEALDSQGSSIDAAKLNVISVPWMLPALASVVLTTIPACFLLSRRKKLTHKRFFKVGEVLLCLLLSFTMLLVPISAVNAASPKGRAEIWGAESTGGYDSRIPGSWKYWRKTYNEIQYQRIYGGLISDYFIGNGYNTSNNQGPNSLKEYILNDISYNGANYPRMAVVDFDHGVGTTSYVQGEWHYMIEDNVGTIMEPWRDDGQYVMHNEHAVYDMDIHPRISGDKPLFAFINTCMSANIADYVYGYLATQGFIPSTYRARGMPFAWTHRIPNVGISGDGYNQPDTGDFCYIGFTRGAAALDQIITMDSQGYNYGYWVHKFFENALTEDLSVKQAMDQATLDLWAGHIFAETPLYNGFTANWPTWNITHGWHDNKWLPEGQDRMVVYGNGNMHLYQKGGIWHLDGNAVDDLHGNNGDIHGATWTYPKFGSYAMNFDGNDDYMEVYPFDYDFTEITAEFWMKTSDTTKTGTPISCSSGTQHNEFTLFNYKSFNVYIKGSYVSTGVSANDGKWHHITVTWRKSDGSVKLYKDGAPVYSGTLQAGATINVANLILGQEQDAFRGGFDPAQAFKGAIDEIRIYDYVLSQSQIADNAAVASYHLNGGNSAYDSSPYVNTGTVYGASWATGPRTSIGFNYGLSFDDYDYVNVTDSNSLDLSSAVTVEAWIKPSRLDVWQSPLEKGAHNDWAYGFYIEPAGGNIGFEIGKEGSTVTWAGAVAPVNTYLAVGKWSHIVGTADTATHKVCLYIDGVKVPNEGYISGQINTNSIPFQIGKRYDGGYFGGVIDEVRIYDRALSSSEISSYYAANLPRHWLTVSAIWDQYGATLYPWIKVDGQYITGIADVSRGIHTVEVENPIWDPYLGYFYFDHFTYDSTTNYNNPMTLTVSKDTQVTAYYHWYGW